jgi:hypothetical protein
MAKELKYFCGKLNVYNQYGFLRFGGITCPRFATNAKCGYLFYSYYIENGNVIIHEILNFVPA